MGWSSLLSFPSDKIIDVHARVFQDSLNYLSSITSQLAVVWGLTVLYLVLPNPVQTNIFFPLSEVAASFSNACQLHCIRSNFIDTSLSFRSRSFFSVFFSRHQPSVEDLLLCEIIRTSISIDFSRRIPKFEVRRLQNALFSRFTPHSIFSFVFSSFVSSQGSLKSVFVFLWPPLLNIQSEFFFIGLLQCGEHDHHATSTAAFGSSY